VGLDVEQVAGRRFRQHQRVSWRARHDVEERQHLVILVDLVTGQLATQNFSENVLRVVARHESLLHRQSIWSMILSENRFPLFGIMLGQDQSCSCSAKSLRNGASAASSWPADST